MAAGAVVPEDDAALAIGRDQCLVGDIGKGDERGRGAAGVAALEQVDDQRGDLDRAEECCAAEKSWFGTMSSRLKLPSGMPSWVMSGAPA